MIYPKNGLRSDLKIGVGNESRVCVIFKAFKGLPSVCDTKFVKSQFEGLYIKHSI